MPLEIAHPMGLQPTTKRGAVSHVVRVFFEAMMALKTNQRQTELMFRLGDLINYLYPGYITEEGKKNHKAFNRSNQLPHIIKALEILHFYATVPWIDDQGDLRRWRPVTVKSPLERTSKNDTPIFMGVDLPPDAKQGYLIIKKTHRELGKASAPQFNAYHTAAWLWDKHGTTPKGIIDPTKPIEGRDEQGHLLNEHEKTIFTTKGKHITNLYAPEAIKQLPREENPARERYPILSFSDLVLSCFPNPKPERENQNLTRAKEHWESLEALEYIKIERLQNGWRIMPSESHLKAYRAMQKAQRKSFY